MYLTKMPINTRRSGAAKLLAYPEAMHAAVASSFPPDALAETGGRELWRVDVESPERQFLYVVSPVEPDLSHIVEQAGWQTGEMWQTRDYSGVLNRISRGDVYVFRLRANVVHYGRPGPDVQTKPSAHRTIKHQQQWLIDRAERNGFEISDGPGQVARLHIVDRGVMRFGKKDSSRVTIAHATFEGTLRVTDPDAMRTALTGGIGRAKAYGCGLMTLAPAP